MEPLEESFDRVLAVVAHPDDLEYGSSSAIAKWSAAGKQIGYVIVTDGEAGIDGVHPDEAGPLRRAEQVASATIVGVDDVVFLGAPDGMLEGGLELRTSIAREIRRFRPDVLLTATHRLTFGDRQLNQADHRHVAMAVLDAAKDAGNRWFRTDALDDADPHPGVHSILLMGSTDPTHAVDVTEHLDTGIASLRAHQAYLAGLGRAFDPAGFLRESTRAPGLAIGVPHAVAFEQLLNLSV